MKTSIAITAILTLFFAMAFVSLQKHEQSENEKFNNFPQYKKCEIQCRGWSIDYECIDKCMTTYKKWND